MENDVPETDEDDLRKLPDDHGEETLRRGRGQPRGAAVVDHRQQSAGERAPAGVTPATRAAALVFQEALYAGSITTLRRAHVLPMIQAEPRELPPLVEAVQDTAKKMMDSMIRLTHGKSVGQARLNWLRQADQRLEGFEADITQALQADDADKALLQELLKGVGYLREQWQKAGVGESIPAPESRKR